MKDYISEKINIIIKKYGFSLTNNQNNLFWKKNDDSSVTINFISKNIKTTSYRSSNKNDKSKSSNNKYNWEITLKFTQRFFS